jgi:hypothetical protein
MSLSETLVSGRAKPCLRLRLRERAARHGVRCGFALCLCTEPWEHVVMCAQRHGRRAGSRVLLCFRERRPTRRRSRDTVRSRISSGRRGAPGALHGRAPGGSARRCEPRCGVWQRVVSLLFFSFSLQTVQLTFIFPPFRLMHASTMHRRRPLLTLRTINYTVQLYLGAPICYYATCSCRASSAPGSV